MNLLQEIRVPQESVNDRFLNVVGISFNNGDKINKNESLIELETSKAIIELEGDYEGYVEYLCALNDEVNVNDIIIKIWDEPISIKLNETYSSDIITEELPSAITEKKSETIQTIFSEKATLLMNHRNIDPNVFRHLDFVNELTVERHCDPTLLVEEKKDFVNLIEDKPLKGSSLIDNSKIILKKLSHAKKREIEYLSDVQSSGLVSVIYIDLNIDNIFENVNENFKYLKDSALPIVAFEASKLLVKFPMFNSYFSNEGIAQYKEVNLGIAMDMDDGLKVVKIPNSNKMQILEIEESIFNLANKYLDKKLNTFDLSDITFTITDLSSFGAISFSPLINKNNSAILGLSKVDQKLKRITVSLAFDHRVTEGKMASIFLQELKERFESYKLDQSNNINLKFVECYKCLKTLDEDFNDIGFIKVLSKNGEDKYICDLCLMKY